MLSACSNNNPNNIITNDGKFSNSKADTLTVKYTINHNRGFSATLDFKLTEGKVDWEIVNPKNVTVLRGYVIYENGKVFRELTYPTHYMNGQYNNKEEITSETDSDGNVINLADFGYLQFEPGSIAGEYTLKLTPENAEGSYSMLWANRINDL